MINSLSLSVDGNGEIYVTGTFHGALSLGRRTFSQQGDAPQWFVAKFSPSGELVWCNCPRLPMAEQAELDEQSAPARAEQSPPGPRSVDGAFSWMETGTAALHPSNDEAVDAATAARSEPATAPTDGASAAESWRASAPAEPDRDSFEPVWLAEGDEGSVPAATGEPGAWRHRLSRGLGYSLGFAGAASAVGVLTMALLQPPAGDWSSPAAIPAAVGSLQAGRVSIEIPAVPSAPVEDAPATATLAEGPDGEDAHGGVGERVQEAFRVERLPDGLVPQGSPVELRQKTIELLTRGNASRALPWARALVASDPHHALSYLCLGAALIDLGRRPEAQQVFAECVRSAKRGDRSECAALHRGR